MNSSKVTRRIVATLAGAALLLSACGSSAGATTAASAPSVASNPVGSAAPASAPSVSSAPVASAAASAAVSIKDFDFQPVSLTVPVGTTITWTNNGAVQHTVTADDDSFDSASLAVGATYSTTAHLAGTIAYHCTIHPQMKGTIVVGP